MTDDGEIVNLKMTMAEYDLRVKDGNHTLGDGRVARTNWAAYSSKNGGVSTVPSNYPMESSSVGVHPDQIKEHMDHLRKMGCGQVDHTSEGDVIFRDKAQRKQVCEALGMFDRNGGYSDPSPRHLTTCKRYR